jgi:hypothetical protein
MQILEPPPIPVMDLVTEEEDKGEEEGDLEPPTASKKDVKSAEEEDLDARDTGKNTEREIAALVACKHLPSSSKEFKARARAKSKWVNYYGRKWKPAKRTRIESSLSLERPKIEADDEGYEGDREMGAPKRAREFWSKP